MTQESVINGVIGEIAIIVCSSWLLGLLARRLGQPTVVGQIVAGLALGPSLLGRIPGNPSAHLFPASSRPILSALSQIAIVIFMFVVGYELDLRLVRSSRRGAAVISLSALLTPMALGFIVVGVFRGVFHTVDSQHADRSSFAPFIAVAVAITALPVLAAIIREHGLAPTPVGTIALTSAGLMDAGAWIALAGVMTGGSATRFQWEPMLLLVAALTAGLILVVRPALTWWFKRPSGSQGERAVIAATLALSTAWATATIGLHPVFGGLLAGLAMPRLHGRPDPTILRPMEACASLLLPLFFVTTGMSVNVGAIGMSGLVLLMLLLLIAVGGKTLPAYAASRLSGLKSIESALVAILLNARGLTELIALNVALNAGTIGQRLFTVLVLMALATTLMTAPLLNVIKALSAETQLRACVLTPTDPG